MGLLNIANRLGDTKTNQFAAINKTDAPQRSFKLGNNHITTANFGDLIPAFWCEARPRDKFVLDLNILAKFLALLAPAYCKADITVDWFFVPTKLISPRSLEFLQNSEIKNYALQQNNVFDVNSSVYGKNYITKENDAVNNEIYGIPRVNLRHVTGYLQSNNGTLYNDVLYGLSYFQTLQSSKRTWLSPSTISSINQIGFEDLNCFGNKYRVSRLLDYMGLPKSVTTLRYMDDVFTTKDHAQSGFNSVGMTVLRGADTLYTNRAKYLNPQYIELFNNDPKLYCSCALSKTESEISYTSVTVSSSDTPTIVNGTIPNNNYTLPYFNFDFDYTGKGIFTPMVTNIKDIDIDIRPFMAYQKIYADYYRDPVKQDIPRLYKDFVGFHSDFTESSEHTDNIGNTLPNTAFYHKRLYNNLFSLRRRNYDKDLYNNCLLSTQLVTQTNVNYQPFNSRFLNNVYKFALKKAVTGNKYFDWLANFMDARGNDYLTNNVTYIGGSRFPITISETLQTSQTDKEVSPQGNRSGNMNAYQNTNKHYFSAPDFGYIMCIVSLLPKITYFNGIPQRFRNLTLLSQDLPDFNNIGFQPVSSDEIKLNRSSEMSSNVFGYLPFGYQHKTQLDLVTGDFSKSLSYWHQSPDLDSPYLVDYTNNVSSSADFATSFSAFRSSSGAKPFPNSADFPAVGLKQVNNNLLETNEYYNNIFAVTTDASGDHCQLSMDFYVQCSRAMSENEILVDDSLI